MKYRKKPITVEASRWFKDGDLPEVVKFRERFPGDLQNYCQRCQKNLDSHGWIETLEGGYVVCPGDWIITGIKNEKYPCKPDIFEATYELVAEEI